MSDAGWGTALRVAGSALVSALPGFLLRRQYPPDRVATNVIVDVRSIRGIRMNLHGAVPTFELVLQYVNLNPFPVTIERVDFEVWFGQPIIDKQVWQKVVIPAHRSHPAIVYDAGSFSRTAPPRFEFKLDANDMKWLETQMEARRLKVDVTVHIDVYGKALGLEFSKQNQHMLIPAHQVDGQG